MKTEVVSIEVKTGDSADKIDKVKKSVKDLKDTSNEATGEVTASLDKMTNGSVSKFLGLFKSIKTVVGGFNLMKVAIIGTGLGALFIAITSIIAAFKHSEAGQDKYAKLMGVIGSVTGNVMDVFEKLGNIIIGVFENPKQALINFKEALEKNITNRIKGLVELLPKLGKVISLVFRGEFKEAGAVAANAIAKVTLGTTNLTKSIKGASDALKKLAKETADDAKKAAEIAEMRDKADDMERALIDKKSTSENRISDLREKASEKDKYSRAERQKFLMDAVKINNDIANQEIAIAILRRDAIIEENKLFKPKEEALIAEQQAIAKVHELDTERLNFKKSLNKQLSAMNLQEMAEEKALADGKIAIETKKQDDISKIISDYALKRLTDLAVTDFQKIELQKNQAVKELDLLKATEEQKASIIKYYDDALAKQREVDAEIIFDKNVLFLKEKQDKEDAYRKAKFDAEQNLVTALAGLAGNETKIGRALLIAKQSLVAQQLMLDVKSYLSSIKKSALTNLATGAEASVDVAAGAAKTLKSKPFPWNLPLVLGYATTAVGIMASVKSALSKSKAVTGSYGGGGGGLDYVSPNINNQAQATSFNLVGQSGTNQLATAISNQTQQPIKAYVVSTEITSAQALDRRILASATLG